MAAFIIFTVAMGIFISFTPKEWKDYYNELNK